MTTITKIVRLNILIGVRTPASTLVECEFIIALPFRQSTKKKACGAQNILFGF
jgi:hypothetical protein